MKISELKETKIIQRPTRESDESGNRIYEDIEVQQSLPSTIQEKHWIRYYAKLFDLLPFLIVFHFIFKFHFFIAFCCSIIAIILINSISESIWGTTIGKRMFNLKVINNYGNHPKFHHSILRNFLPILTFDGDLSILPEKVLRKFGVMTFFTSFRNNEETMIYIVNKSEYKRIKDLLLDNK